MNPKLIEVLAYVLDVDPATLNEQSAPDNVQGWDSMRNVFLLSTIEQTFGVTLSNAEFTGARNAGDLQAILDRRGAS